MFHKEERAVAKYNNHMKSKMFKIWRLWTSEHKVKIIEIR